MRENQISGIILDAAIKVHRELGPGLLESVYETVLAYELDQRGLQVERQRAIPVVYTGVKLDDGFRADLIVGKKVIVEIKSQEAVPKVAYKILRTYLKFSGLKLGILINFGEETIIQGFDRVVYGLED